MKNSQEDEDDIACMQTTIKIFRFYGVFPKKEKMSNPGPIFYIKFILMASCSSLILVGSLLHLIHTIRDGTKRHIELDMINILTMSAVYGVICSYIVKINHAVELYRSLSNFKEFGKPTDFDKNNALWNKYSKFHYIYLQSIIIFILMGSNIFRGGQCHRENERKHMHDICGLVTYTWMPFDIDYFPVKQIYVIIQLAGADYLYKMVGFSAWMVLETSEHLLTRIRHVPILFMDALDEADPVIRRKKFRTAVRYHVSVLSLEDKVNRTYSGLLFIHLVMAGVIMGYGMYAYTQVRSMGTFLLSIGWVFGLYIDFHSGQNVQDECERVAFAIYNSQWYNLDTEMKRDVMFVLMRCQREIVLKAASFGVINHPLFLAVIKGSYSYFTVMN